MDSIEIGKRIKKRRKELLLTQEELGNRLNFNKSTIQRYENGKIDTIKLPVLQAIAKALNVSPEYLALKTDEPGSYYKDENPLKYPGISPLPPTKKLPLLGTIACGEPILAEENIEEYIDVDEEVKADFVLRCKGDSMVDARIHDGDLVYIHQQADVENGEIAAVLIDNEATLKKVYKYPEKEMVILRAANSSFDDLVYSGSELEAVRIIGKAVGFYSKIR